MDRKKLWWVSMLSRYTPEEIAALQAENGSIGGAAKVKKGLAVVKEKDPEKYAEIRRKANEARWPKK